MKIISLIKAPRILSASSQTKAAGCLADSCMLNIVGDILVIPSGFTLKWREVYIILVTFRRNCLSKTFGIVLSCSSKVVDTILSVPCVSLQYHRLDHPDQKHQSIIRSEISTSYDLYNKLICPFIQIS